MTEASAALPEPLNVYLDGSLLGLYLAMRRLQVLSWSRPVRLHFPDQADAAAFAGFYGVEASVGGDWAKAWPYLDATQPYTPDVAHLKLFPVRALEQGTKFSAWHPELEGVPAAPVLNADPGDALWVFARSQTDPEAGAAAAALKQYGEVRVCVWSEADPSEYMPAAAHARLAFGPAESPVPFLVALGIPAIIHGGGNPTWVPVNRSVRWAAGADVSRLLRSGEIRPRGAGSASSSPAKTYTPIAYHLAEPPKPSVSGSGEWAVAIGAWGDTFWSIGQIRHLGLWGCNLIHIGFDAGIAEWAGRQHGIARALHYRPASWEAYMALVVPSCNQTEEQAGNWIAPVLRELGLPEDLPVRQTQMNTLLDAEPHFWSGAVLDPAAEAWAAGVLACCPKPPVLLHPYSGSSNYPNEHWLLWADALEWLGQEVEASWLWTGMAWPEPDWGPRPLLPGEIDLLGQTPTMEHILALSRRSRGVVATSNSLSMWSTIAARPSLIVMNAGLSDVRHGNGFRRWVEHPANTLLPNTAGLDEFQRTWRDWWPKL